MPESIILGKFTQEGIEKIKESPKRLKESKDIAESFGGEIKNFYYTAGQYDFVAISEAPDIESLMKALFTIGSEGSVRTETLIAIPAEEIGEIIQKMP